MRPEGMGKGQLLIKPAIANLEQTESGHLGRAYQFMKAALHGQLLPNTNEPNGEQNQGKQ